MTALRIASHGRRLDIARFLGPRERETFAAALGAALAKVRGASRVSGRAGDAKKLGAPHARQIAPQNRVVRRPATPRSATPK